MIFQAIDRLNRQSIGDLLDPQEALARAGSTA
jgi:hypothetical protein